MKFALITAAAVFAALVALWPAGEPVGSVPRSISITAPVSKQAAGFAITRPEFALASGSPHRRYEIREAGFGELAAGSSAMGRQTTVRASQKTFEFSSVEMPPPLLSFPGLANYDNAAEYNLLIMPPDMVGDVGPEHYVQAVNSLYRVYSKTGSPLSMPARLSSLFAPLGTACSSRNDGLPVVMHDQFADRWVISQTCTAFPPFRQMIAVSRTADPLGEYYAYEFVMPNFKLNDFPKLGLWTDGYYMSTDEFVGSDYAGAGIFAFDRDKMLTGDPTASYIYFSMASGATARRGGMLPADLDGLTPPPAGAPAIFATYTANEYGDTTDALRLYAFRPDFDAPQASTFTELAESPITVAEFDPTSPDGRADIAQPPPGEFLDSQSDRLNFRLAYRNLSEYESIVVNQTVRIPVTGSVYRAGVRVYELRRSNGSFVPFVQTTIGDAGASRWVGAVAQDGRGNLAVQYNLASEQKKPSIMYAGRLAADAPNTLRSERTLVAGTGVQKAFGFRWGDYSGMSVDPVDDCTFWMTNSYYTAESEQWSDAGWLTQIGSFKFAECTPAPRGKIKVRLINALTSQPIGNGLVKLAPPGSAATFTRTTMSSGETDTAIVPPEIYRVSGTASGYSTEELDVAVENRLDTTAFVELRLDPVSVIRAESLQPVVESCRINRHPEPGETVAADLTLRNSGAAAATDLRAELVTGGGIISAEPAREFGTLAPGAFASRRFNFTVQSGIPCGSNISLSFVLTENGQPAGSVMVELIAGERKTVLAENFDSVTAPSLPTGWTTSSTDGHQLWSTSTARPRSGLQAAYSPAPFQPGVNELVSPEFRIVTPKAQVRFSNWYELETTFLRNRLYDGAVLEIQLDGERWQDAIDAGGRFLSRGYDGTIDSCCSNPLAGRLGWSGRSGIQQTSEYVETVVQLPVSASGRSVRLRWRVGTDIGTSREGLYIDDVVVTDGFSCGCGFTRKRGAPFDLDGDGRTDLAVVELNDSGAPDLRAVLSGSGSEWEPSFGGAGDVPAAADLDGDGRTDLAYFRPATGEWWMLKSSGGISTVNFGVSGDRPLPADYDGDGAADIAVYRPQNGTWYILRSSDAETSTVRFGVAADIPVPADHDGDGRTDIAVFRPGTAEWWILRSTTGEVTVEKFGLAGDVPITGYFDDDQTADIGVFRSLTGIWYLRRSAQGQLAVRFGLAGDRPLRADMDGDGRDDVAVFRPSTGDWYHLESSTSQAVRRSFATDRGVPLPGIYTGN